MSTCSTSGSVFDDRLLAAVLDEAIASDLRPRPRVELLARRPFSYQTSSPLEEVTVGLDGAELTLLFKDLSPDAVRHASGGVKPAFLANACREIDAYSRALQQAEFGTARFYGSIVKPAAGRFGLILELVSGRDLWQIGELEIWQEAASWLGRFHRFWSDQSSQVHRIAPRAIRHDAAFYRLWVDRAAAYVDSGISYSTDERRAFIQLTQRFERIVDRLVALPSTLLHGDFFASNILVVDTEDEVRICPIDWELNGIGPGLVDLAALVSGKWTGHERESSTAAYFAANDPHGGTDSIANLSQSLACCRLHLAMRMLGWASEWTPPAEHRHDWLGEALRLGEQLGLLL